MVTPEQAHHPAGTHEEPPSIWEQRVDLVSSALARIASSTLCRLPDSPYPLETGMLFLLALNV
jgi:hypothetical protein